MASAPGPQLHDGVQPKSEVIRRDVRPVIPQLLLAGTMDFLDIVEILFDGCTVGHRLQDLGYGRLRIRAEIPVR